MLNPDPVKDSTVSDLVDAVRELIILLSYQFPGAGEHLQNTLAARNMGRVE